MKKKLTVTVGIPAYNEAANIKVLLLSVLHQKELDFCFENIIVNSDGSTDATVKEVQSLKDSRLILLNHKERRGQAERQNEIIRNTSSDVLVLLNADIRIEDPLFINKIVQPIADDNKVGLVSVRRKPFVSGKMFETIINFSVYLKQDAFVRWKRGNNLYLCCGAARSLSRKFYKNFQWPQIVNEDSYSYLECIKKGLKFVYQPNTYFIYKSPDNFKDHLKQSVRFQHSREELIKYFDERIISNEYAIPKIYFIYATVKYFIKNPFVFSMYIAVLIISKIKGYKTKLNVKWDFVNSSKSFN